MPIPDPHSSSAPPVPALWWGLLPFALAMVDTLVSYRLNALALGSLLVLGIVAASLYGVSSVIAAFVLPALPYREFVVLTLLGIVFGAFADAAADSGDRPLLGTEIALFGIVSLVPILLGVRLGRLLNARAP